MKKINLALDGEMVNLRLIQVADKDLYYSVGFEHEYKEAAYFTGTTENYSQEVTDRYIDRIVNDESRYDFLIFDLSNRLLGEAVINNIEDNRFASFRIGLFRGQYFNRGIGTEAIQLVLKFAFESRCLHRLELEVFDYNPRAKHVYEKVGFVQEGVKRDAMFINGEYHGVILMSILDTEYKDRLGIS